MDNEDMEAEEWSEGVVEGEEGQKEDEVLDVAFGELTSEEEEEEEEEEEVVAAPAVAVPPAAPPPAAAPGRGEYFVSQLSRSSQNVLDFM